MPQLINFYSSSQIVNTPSSGGILYMSNNSSTNASVPVVRTAGGQQYLTTRWLLIPVSSDNYLYIEDAAGNVILDLLHNDDITERNKVKVFRQATSSWQACPPEADINSSFYSLAAVDLLQYANTSIQLKYGWYSSGTKPASLKGVIFPCASAPEVSLEQLQTLTTKVTSQGSDIETLKTTKTQTSVTSALEVRVTALQGAQGAGTVTTYQPFVSVTDNKVTFSGNIPIGVKTNKNNYYPIQKASLQVSGSDAVLDVTPYLAYDNSSAFAGQWIAYFASGTSPQQVLQWMSPDPNNYQEIPAVNTQYTAPEACWIFYSIFDNTTGTKYPAAIFISPVAAQVNPDYNTSHPMGSWSQGYVMAFCPKGWSYYLFLNSGVDLSAIGYKLMRRYKCKGVPK